MFDKILFVLKKRASFDRGTYTCLSSGLRNSVLFVLAMLRALGIEAEMIEVGDNNEIDAAVTHFRPTHVIIEAFWVVPEKFDVLQALHPDVRWIVRNHSEVPFLANEGIAFGWIAGYLNRGIEVMCNSPRALADTRGVAMAYGLSDRLVTYGPNYYPLETGAWSPTRLPQDGPIEVGCFGAIRPLKNTMMQALAAIAAARHLRRPLNFHINATRPEGNGDPILKNLRQMFAAMPQHTLVEHEWLDHPVFCDLISQMHLVAQVSFSETFNIVAADAVWAGVPIVVSREVPWIGEYAHAEPTSVASIAKAMLRVLEGENLSWRLNAQARDLRAYCRETEKTWSERFATRETV